MEIWKTIEGYPDYEVSDLGRVKSVNYRHTGKEKIMKYGFSCGYPFVNIFKDKKRKKYYIHRLVASAFIDNPNNLPQVNHKDEDKTNNRVENLEWCDCSYNVNYGTRNNKVAKALYNRKDLSKPIIQYSKEGKMIIEWDSAMDIQRELGFLQGNISSCCRGERNTAYGYRWRYYDKILYLESLLLDRFNIKNKRVA